MQVRTRVGTYSSKPGCREQDKLDGRRTSISKSIHNHRPHLPHFHKKDKDKDKEKDKSAEPSPRARQTV